MGLYYLRGYSSRFGPKKTRFDPTQTNWSGSRSSARLRTQKTKVAVTSGVLHCSKNFLPRKRMSHQGKGSPERNSKNQTLLSSPSPARTNPGRPSSRPRTKSSSHSRPSARGCRVSSTWSGTEPTIRRRPSPCSRANTMRISTRSRVCRQSSYTYRPRKTSSRFICAS